MRVREAVAMLRTKTLLSKQRQRMMKNRTKIRKIQKKEAKERELQKEKVLSRSTQNLQISHLGHCGRRHLKSESVTDETHNATTCGARSAI